MFFVLIPYIQMEDDAAEVWIAPVSAPPATPAEVVAVLARFADADPENPETIAEHCDAWHADRILLPDACGTQWRSVWIADALDGRLVDTSDLTPVKWTRAISFEDFLNIASLFMVLNTSRCARTACDKRLAEQFFSLARIGSWGTSTKSTALWAGPPVSGRSRCEAPPKPE